MELTHAFLVSIMFVIVLSMGIATLLTTIAAIINRRAGKQVDRIHLGWIILLLLTHFNLFWHTQSILNVEKWGYLGFVYTIAGPILLFLASSIMVPDEANEDAESLGGFYFRIARKFLAVLVLLQLWMIGVDTLVLGHGIVGSTYFNVAALAVAVWLMFTDKPALHRTGIVLMWLMYLAALALRTAGLIG